MKKYTLLALCLICFASITFTGCKKQEDPIKKGSVVFWTGFDAGSNIHVYMADNSGYITLSVPFAPECNANGCFTTKAMPYGKYQFTAYNDLYSWSGEVNITSDCNNIQLFK